MRTQVRAEVVLPAPPQVPAGSDCGSVAPAIRARHPRGVRHRDGANPFHHAVRGRRRYRPQPFATVAGIDPTPFVPVAGVDPQPFRTGLFGIKEGQAIRVSVLNAGEVGGIIAPCVRFLDLDGTLLLEAVPEPVAAGVGAFMDFDPLPPGPTRTPGFRRQLRVRSSLFQRCTHRIRQLPPARAAAMSISRWRSSIRRRDAPCTRCRSWRWA